MDPHQMRLLLLELEKISANLRWIALVLSAIWGVLVFGAGR